MMAITTNNSTSVNPRVDVTERLVIGAEHWWAEVRRLDWVVRQVIRFFQRIMWGENGGKRHR